MMSQKHLRTFRVFVSIVFLLLTAALFVDFREFIPVEWDQYILFPQFVPSLIRFITLPSFVAAGFLLILLLTLLFGRVFCSTFCPLGILQDVFSYLSKKVRIIKRYKFKRPMNYLRYPFLILSAFSLLFGSMLVLNLLDPYSSFGRIFSGMGRPLVVSFNNLLAKQLEKFDIYFLFRLDMGLFTWNTVFVPAITLALIIWLSAWFGRLYCNTLCPVGTSLGLLSRISLFRIKMDAGSCTQCGKCVFSCKSNCIDIKNLAVDFSRCVACYDCIPVCESHSISYKPVFPASPEKHRTDTSKRDFMGKAMVTGLALAGIRKGSPAQDHTVLLPGDIPNNRQYPVSPPGSVSLEHFNDRCTACHLCVTACPTGVLQPSLMEYGLSGFMQPHMDFTVEYCNYECTICSQVCPTSAIMPMTVEDKKLTQTGQVNLILEKCVVVTDNTACGSCSEHCPTQAVTMIPYENAIYDEELTIPEIRPDYCIGCGACEFACPVRPYPAIFVDGHTVHKVAMAPQIEELDTETFEDFPF